MKILIILSLALFSAKANGDLYVFPVGETPCVSMITALNYFSDLSKKRNKPFNPMSCFLGGGPNKEEGTWIITQIDKNGDEIKFVYYFPKDMCIISKTSDGRILNEAFKRDGTPIPLEEKPFIDEKEPDPFAPKPESQPHP